MHYAHGGIHGGYKAHSHGGKPARHVKMQNKIPIRKNVSGFFFAGEGGAFLIKAQNVTLFSKGNGSVLFFIEKYTPRPRRDKRINYSSLFFGFISDMR